MDADRKPLSEDERKSVYISLLQGMADEAQKRMCAEDKSHAWGNWVRYQIRRDDVPLRFDPSMKDEVVRIGARRECLCCGKEQTQK